MPLTPSHAAVAPLLHRVTRRLGVIAPMSAVVIGTMTPDFDYLIRLTPGGSAWHSAWGLLLFCLPAGLATWWIFRAIIAPALLRLMPPALGAEAARLVAPGPTHRLLPAAALAILAGAASHDLWDSFTHEGRWGVRHLRFLRTRVPTSPSTGIHWYLILQYASSLIGLIVVLLICWRWVQGFPKSARDVPPGDRAWRVREAALLLLVTLLGAVLNELRPHPPGLSWRLGLAAVGGMSALAVALFAYGILDVLRHRASRGRLSS